MSEFLHRLALWAILTMAVTATVTAGLMLNSCEVASAGDTGWYVHPAWMSRDVGETVGNRAFQYALPWAILVLITVMWVSYGQASRVVRQRFPRER